MAALIRIDADLLVNVDGRGGVRRSSTVLISGSSGKILSVANLGEVSATAAALNIDLPSTVDAHVPVLLPGLFDAHVHLMGATNLDFASWISTTPTALAAARACQCLRAALLAGVTSVRDLAGMGCELARAAAEGTIPSPHIYSAGAIISPTGGHADIHCFPVSVLDEMHTPSSVAECARTCDGEAAARKVVREQVRRNCKLIKICTSGGVLSEVDHIAHQQFSAGEIAAIVEEAGFSHRVVAAHAHGTAGIKAAILGGCRTIEHGTFFDMETAQLAKDRGVLVVPTLLILSRFDTSKAPAWAAPKALAAMQSQQQSLRLVHSMGVRLAMGTDIATFGRDSACPWGRHGEELALMIQTIGISPAEAIVAATTNPPFTLGDFHAPKTGVLAEGYDADLISLPSSPLDDNCAVLANPDNVLHVWLRGKKVKENGRIIGFD